MTRTGIKKILLSVLLSALCGIVSAQKQGNVWAFGDQLGVDFNSGSPVSIQTSIETNEGCASICDKNGQLLFYTEGSFIWNKLGTLMANGSDLTGLDNATGGLTSATYSTTQGAVIVPMPDSANIYYVFSLTQLEGGVQIAGRLFYSIVNMNLDGGLGDVESGRKGIIIDSGLTEKMTAVIGDRCDVWLMVVASNPAQFRAFEITDAGINPAPVMSNTTFPIAGADVIKFSPNRKKLAVCSGMQLYDFDPVTGIVSNGVLLKSQGYYGACFSPDNSKLYASPVFGDDGIYQFDLTAGNTSAITASEVSLGPCNSDMKIGPDNKMYFSVATVDPNTGFTSLAFGVINEPNLSGAACQYGGTGINFNNVNANVGVDLPNVLAIFTRDTSTSTKAVTTCFKDSVTLYANDSGWNYLWDDGSIQTYRTVYQSGNYIVHYFIPPCTYHIDTFAVNFASLIPLTGSLSGCYGQHNGRAWVQPQTGDTTTYTYTWTDALGVTLQSPTTSRGIADSLYNQYPGTYTVTLHGLDGCDTSIPVKIDTPYYTGFIHASDTGMCPNDTITIHATGGVSYKWQPDDLTYISDTSIADPRVSPQTNWSYLVYGTNSSGCLDTATAHVHVFPDAVIRLPDSVVLYYEQSFQFNPETNCLAFSWFPLLGLSAGDIANPIANPPVDTKYIVTGTTEAGCKAQDSVNVYRSDAVILTLPNAFTPGNGPDNLLKPIYKGDITLDYFRVFNRWGQLVYESSDLNQGWDGTWHGTPQVEGVFVYTIQGHTAAGKVLSKQGNITLLR